MIFPQHHRIGKKRWAPRVGAVLATCWALAMMALTGHSGDAEPSAQAGEGGIFTDLTDQADIT